MANDYNDDQEETDEARPRYCEACRVLTEALRDMEQQCREAEDGGYWRLCPSSSSVSTCAKRTPIWRD
jgi:hypothetical protein